MDRKLSELKDLQPTSVVLIKPSSLGDVVHATPVLAALGELWPDARFSWVINAGLIDLVRGLPRLHEAIRFERPKAKATPSGVAYLSKFLIGLRRRRFDLAIDLQGLLRSGLMAAATGARVRVGFADAREGAPRFYTHRIAPEPGAEHAVDRLLGMTRAFGSVHRSPQFLDASTSADRRRAELLLAEVPRPRLVLNLGARWLTKRWPPSQFAAVARRAFAELGAGLVAVGAPEDRPLVAELRERLGSVPILDLCGQTSLLELSAIAAASDLFLSNDTGPLHLATAAGARVLGIYTCTRPEWTGPYGKAAGVVKSEIWCAGSCVKTCPRLDCFGELTADRVYREVARILSSSSDPIEPPPPPPAPRPATPNSRPRAAAWNAQSGRN